MLEILVASRAPRTLRPRWLSGSLLVHLLLAALAVEGSRVHARSTEVVVADTTLLFLPRLAPPQVERPPRARPVGLGGSGGGGSIVVSATPPPRGFQTVVAPTDIPSSIPPVDLSQPALDPRNFAGRGAEGGVAWGVTGGTGPVEAALIPPDVAAGDVVYTATLEDARFEPAQLVSQPPPRYPRAMEVIAMSGRVMIQFIVDTTGGVEVRSIQVLESSHDAFEAPARESVAGAVFRPARLGAIPVRQLTRQPIRFVASQ
jgi:TonB family protein